MKYSDALNETGEMSILLFSNFKLFERINKIR